MSKVMNPAEWLKGRYSKAQRRTTESGLSPIYSSREVVGLLEEYAANVAAHARQETARQVVTGNELINIVCAELKARNALLHDANVLAVIREMKFMSVASLSQLCQHDRSVTNRICDDCGSVITYVPDDRLE